MKKWVGPSVAILGLGLAFWLLRAETSGLSWLQVRAAVAGLPAAALALSVALTGVHYLVLTGYDTLAVRHVGVRLPRGQVTLASTVGYAFSQGLGFPLLTGAPMRTRLYASWGVSPSDIARVVAVCTSSLWVGFAAVGGAALFLAPPEMAGAAGLPPIALRIAGVALGAGLVVYGGGALWGRESARIGRVTIPLPTPRLLAGQVGVGGLDWLVAGLVLWVLLPEGHALGFGHFLATFLLAHGLGMLSTVPGGLAVFEAVFLVFLPGSTTSPEILAGLIAFRAVYYLVPLFLAALVLSLREVRGRADRFGPPARHAATVASQLVPSASAALSFVLGSLLLLSGSVPTPQGRLRALGALVPPSVVEASHFIASLLGLSLIILARGLQLRLDGAYQLAVAALAGGALLALSHDLNVVGTLAFLVGAGILVAARREFYRPASLLDQPFTASWILAIGAVLATSIGLGLFAFAHVEYSSDLWWRFALQDDAPRFLRATVGAGVAVAVFVGVRMLRPAPVDEPPVDSATLDRIAPVVESAADPVAHLVLLGDKRVRTSASGRSFVMFGVSGSSWVAMGDPVGDPTEFDTLVWSLKEEADRAGADLVFYQVGPRHLPLYIELGLVFFKLGERARVSLSGAPLEGKARADLRQAMRRLEREGGTFEVVSPGALAPLVPRLRDVSDAWLESKNVREKRFSLGRFEESYVARFPVGVVRTGGEIMAFATLWTSSAREELSADLIRYVDGAPKGVMDALFGHLMSWGAEEGYRWFNLGVAPFSGLEAHRLAPSWQRLGSALFAYGEHFYNFQGLRAFKEKFDPEWEPCYLAAPPGLGVAGVMADVTGLISGGLRGAVMR